MTKDYSETLFLPVTAFPMRANLPVKEPGLVKRWQEIGLYRKLRDQTKDCPPYVLHDGPPYANGHLHIGHALNKILKDVVTRSFQMRGYNANYVPGWDCHGLPIEWKVEEKYRAAGKNKDEVPVNEFRQECREFAAQWVKIQSEEFKRLGVIGDFDTPYTTMAFASERNIAAELLKFSMSGQLYRGSKPVMWSVVERTVLAEAEVEYHDYESDTIWVKFPLITPIKDLADASIVIWTTTPWTIPGNRAISYSSRIDYGLYEVTAAQEQDEPRWLKKDDRILLACSQAIETMRRAKIAEDGFRLLRTVSARELENLLAQHPLKQLAGGYMFSVPLLDGQHVSDDTGTGFVHTAPGHGADDFDIWQENIRKLETLGISSTIPFTIDDAGFYTEEVPGFGPDREGGAARVLDDHGKKGTADKTVIEALIQRGMLIARARIKHTYPHSWRSKKPIIYRNTPQWFVPMDKRLEDNTSLRERALKAISETRFVPAASQNRLRAMIAERPDWVLSRQRSWGVPICIFANMKGVILKDEDVNERILRAFAQEGADAWFAPGARARFLGPRASEEEWQQVMHILDVWFDSGCSHSFTLEERPDLKWPADLYLEGSDQHRGWFHSSLLESCGTRGRAPYKAVLTHGFAVDEEGHKMSKSLGNILTPQKIIEDSGADILRLWVMSCDYWEDQRLGKTILQTNIDAYRKLRNTLRWMLGTLKTDKSEAIAYEQLPELERLMLHRLSELDSLVRAGYDAFDFKRVTRSLLDFAVVDLSAFYFDIRKDSLYCDAPSSLRRRAALSVIEHIFNAITIWLAPMLPFTTEEAWLERHRDALSIHLEQFPTIPQHWCDEVLSEKWHHIRTVRRVVTGALECDRAHKKIGSSLEAAPLVYIADPQMWQAVSHADMAEICITSAITLINQNREGDCFTLEDVKGVFVVSQSAPGKKCARSWRYSQDVGSDPAFPDVSARDAAALHEILKI